MSFRKGFTLQELLLTLAIVSIVSTLVVITINPAKRKAIARDNQRKTDIQMLSLILREYEQVNESFPREDTCDSSRGTRSGSDCPIPDSSCSPPVTGCKWSTSSIIHTQLITNQKFLKSLPLDPINNVTYYYRYEPRSPGQAPCPSNGIVCRYWIGARMEISADPSKVTVFRCTDIETLSSGIPAGCTEVVYPSYASFDINER